MSGNKTSRAAEPARAEARPGACPPHRILVVDEDSDLRVLYVEALAAPDYHVDLAEDGAAAWKALLTRSYHLLITEHDTPILTGIELVKKVRAARMILPVVMASVRLPTYALARDPSLQLAATLEKPFAVATLLDTVRAVLRAPDDSCEPIEPRPDWQSQPSAIGLRL